MARLGMGTNRQRKLRRRSSSGSSLVAALLVRERAHCGQQGPRRSLVATALLNKCEGLGLRSPCGRLVPTLVVGLRRQHCLAAMALHVECEGLPGASVSSLLAGASGSSLLASGSSLLASGSSLLAGASGLLIEELLTTALVLLAGTRAGASVVLGEDLLEAGSFEVPGASSLLVLFAMALVLLLPFLPCKEGTGCPGGGAATT